MGIHMSIIHIYNLIVNGISVMVINNSHVIRNLHKSRKGIIHSLIPFAQIMILNAVNGNGYTYFEDNNLT